MLWSRDNFNPESPHGMFDNMHYAVNPSLVSPLCSWPCLLFDDCLSFVVQQEATRHQVIKEFMEQARSNGLWEPCVIGGSYVRSGSAGPVETKLLLLLRTRPRWCPA